MRGMNKLPVATRVQILSMLVEGSSLRSISRVVGVSINTVTKLLIDAGNACIVFHDKNVRDVKANPLYDDLRAVQTPDGTDRICRFRIMSWLSLSVTLGFHQHEIAEEHLAKTKVTQGLRVGCQRQPSHRAQEADLSHARR